MRAPTYGACSVWGPAETASDLVAASLTPVINDAAQLALWQEHTRNPVAAHFDTGMKRLGFDWSTGADALGDHPIALLLTHHL